MFKSSRLKGGQGGVGWGVVWEISQQPRWVEEGERVASVEVISWAEARKHDLELNGGANPPPQKNSMSSSLAGEAK